MKFKATKKQMRSNYQTIITVGYCKLQSLLQYEEPIAYSSGINGWSCDYYDIDGVLISTGYKPINSIQPSNDITSKHESRVKDLYKKVLDYDTKKATVKIILNQFIKEVTSK